MKYAIGSSLALVLCLVVGVLAVLLAQKRMNARWPKGLQAALSLACGLALFALVGVAYLETYSAAEPEAEAAMAGSDTVQVSETSNGWLFDGPGAKTALVFYPGAKVETEAYAQLMSRIAGMGVDCFLVDMPFRMAIFDADAADELMGAYTYENWMLGGHSMGGMTAASYASENADSVDGLVMLAAYPTQDLDQGLKLVSVYGDADGVLERDLYEDAKADWPTDAHEVVIEGGNHAGFAAYGEQQGDGQATISADDQQQQTATAVVEAAQQLEAA